jgi:hypothetical protein
MTLSSDSGWKFKANKLKIKKENRIVKRKTRKIDIFIFIFSLRLFLKIRKTIITKEIKKKAIIELSLLIKGSFVQRFKNKPDVKWL